MNKLDRSAFLKGPNSLQAQIKDITMAPLDPISGTRVTFMEDTNENKIYLCLGVYRDSNGQPYPFKIVQKIESALHQNSINHEYLMIEGHLDFIRGAKNLVFGQESSAVKEGRISSTQTISGTGAVSLGMEVIAKFLPNEIYVSKPTWNSHYGIIQKCGLPMKQYTYYSANNFSLDIEGMLDSLKKATPGSIVLLHVCAHNPTGVDPTQDQWKQICEVMKANSLIPFFDSAYQGFASGSLEKDIWPVKYFLEEGFNMFVCQSFAKNMGLYGERIGALHVVLGNRDSAEKLSSQINILVRQMYSTPNRYGAEVVSQILNNKQYLSEWETELKEVVAKRIIDMRHLLRQTLEKIGAPGKWDHITDQVGMFSYTGLSQRACQILINKYHIYLMKTGRITIAGITEKNVQYLAESIKAAIEESQAE